MSQKVESPERLHHPYSASKLQYLEVSPAWTGEESVNKEASQRGTAQHDASEAPVNIDDPSLEDHEAEAVHMCKTYRDELIAANPGCTVLVEKYVHIDDEVEVDEAGNKFPGTSGGYLDLAIITADRKSAHVVDYKFGLWSVEPAENNLQGIDYLLGLVRDFPTLDDVTVHFLLPHRQEKDIATFKRCQFEALLLRVKTVVARAKKARELAKAGDFSMCNACTSTCLFCGHKGRCSKLAEFALRLGKKYNPLVIPEEVNPSLLRDPQQAKLSMEIAQLMEAWGKATRSQITARAIEDDAWMPEGYTLRSRQDYEVVSWEKVEELARAAGVSEEAIKEAKTIRRDPINKAIAAGAPRGSKQRAQEAFRDQLLQSGALRPETPIVFLERNKT
jgi:hypothetical protein